MDRSYIINPLEDHDCVILDGHCNCLIGFCILIEERVREETRQTDTASEVKGEV